MEYRWQIDKSGHTFKLVEIRPEERKKLIAIRSRRHGRQKTKPGEYTRLLCVF